MTEDVNDSDSIIMVTQRGAMKRIDFNVLQEAKRAQRGITLLKELKKKPHRIVAGAVVKENHTKYVVFSQHHEEYGNIDDVHLSEQYTNGSFIIDTDDFGEVESMILE